jgi:transglutaminase-like putative cysteine protease
MMRSRLKLEEGWTSFLLLVLMLLCVVWSVHAAEWTEGLVILQWVALAAAVLGLVLARMRRVPSLAAHVAALIVGALWVTAMLSLVFSPPLVPAGLIRPGTSLVARVTVMGQQALRWWRNPSDAEAWLSNFLFACNLAALTWLLAYSSTWFVFRRHWVWGAVLPSGAAGLLNIYYAPPKLAVYFALYCLCALLLIVRTHVYLRQTAWRKAAVNYSPDVDLTFIRDGALMSILAVLLAWSIPAATTNHRMADFWASFQEPWSRVQTEWTRLFTSLIYQGTSRRMAFGRTLTLGGAVNLSSAPLLEVQAAEPHYWRAVSYDQYTGSGWSDTDSFVLTLQPAADQLRPVPYAMEQELTQTVRMLESGEGLLFSAGQPVRISVAARARVSQVSLSGAPRATDVSMLQAVAALRRNQTYTLVSLVSKAGAKHLQSAGTDYPVWVRRYLQLPDELPERVRRLSREVSEGAVTPYEKAVAIQNYLRRITYDQYVSAPPAGHDVVDWFLFEGRRGYCDYYATAMAVMCRALGIPARVSQGYTPGELMPGSRTYRVRQVNAHAWAEVYFPGFGWIEFEPTSSQPLPSLTEGTLAPLLPGAPGVGEAERSIREDKYGPDDTVPEDVDAALGRVVMRKPWYVRLRPWALATLVTLAAALLLILGWWELGLRGVPSATRAYAELRRLGRLLGVSQAPHQTPLEYGESMGNVFPAGQQDVRRVVVLYVKQQYSRGGLTATEHRELRKLWPRLRIELLRQVLKRRWPAHEPRTVWVDPSSLRP